MNLGLNIIAPFFFFSNLSMTVYVLFCCFFWQIHWLSIINSMVLVFLLIGFVVIIMVGVPPYGAIANTSCDIYSRLSDRHQKVNNSPLLFT